MEEMRFSQGPQELPIQSLSSLGRSSSPQALPCYDYDETSISTTDSFTHKTVSVKTGIVVKKGIQYWKIMLFGQLLSFLLAASSTANATLHLECKISVPAFATMCFFMLLSLFLIPLYIRGEKWKELQEEGLLRGKEVETPQYAILGISLFASVWAYSLIGLFDAVADYVNTLSSNYTTLTSVTIFNALSVPSAMVLSRVCLGRSYTSVHLLGAVVCIAGVFIDVLMDYDSDLNDVDQRQDGRRLDDYFGYIDDDAPEEETFFDYDEKAYPHKVLGDLLAITGGCLYGAIDVMAEYSARHYGGPMEFLAMIGLWGVLFSAVSAFIGEREEIAQLFSTEVNYQCPPAERFSLLAASVLSLFMHSVGVAYFVLFSESALLNMSLLTGNFWAVGFSILGQGIFPDPIFYVALFLIIIGILVYESAPSPVPLDETPVIDALPTTKREFDEFAAIKQHAFKLMEEGDGLVRELGL
jgi:drug/metabolite transporter (DMT)-like permease